jgi:hypothetical protein
MAFVSWLGNYAVIALVTSCFYAFTIISIYLIEYRIPFWFFKTPEDVYWKFPLLIIPLVWVLNSLMLRHAHYIHIGHGIWMSLFSMMASRLFTLGICILLTFLLLGQYRPLALVEKVSLALIVIAALLPLVFPPGKP